MNNFKQLFDPNDQKLYLNEFLEIYRNRPIKNNTGGMKSPHMFNAWYIIKKLQPDIIIESGVWKGQGTWFFENASPNSDIISIDPYPQFREYTSNKAKYITEDFLSINWSNKIKTLNSLVFFDDHQSCIERIKHCKKHNLQRMIFEDNYPYNQGDCYSPKKILSQQSYVIDNSKGKKTYDHNQEDYKYLINNIDTYQEMPPIFTESFTRWGDLWDFRHNTPRPLLNKNQSTNYLDLFEERLDYTWICYIEML